MQSIRARKRRYSHKVIDSQEGIGKKMAAGSIFESEINVDPTGDLILNFLVERDKEEPFVDFKETLSIAKDSPFAKIAKDIFAFSNYGGGFLLVGFRDNKTRITSADGITYNFEPAGLPDDFHLDQADLQTKFNAFSSHPLELRYREFHRIIHEVQKRFAVVYISPSPAVLTPVKEGIYTDGSGKLKKAFAVGDILFRRGTQSVIASREENALIEKRAQNRGYTISVLSGQADEVTETIYSNVFEVVKKPVHVWIADEMTLPPDFTYPIESRWVAYRRWNGKIISFEDLSDARNPLSYMADASSSVREKLDDWFSDPDKERIAMSLLNKEVMLLARKNGMTVDEYKGRIKIYYQCHVQDRKITWKSRSGRTVVRTVAKKMYASQLHREIFWHVAFIPRFVYLDGTIFLQISQSMMITEDGRRPSIGSKEGTVITRLTYNKYNASYLSNLFFWISRLSQESDKVVLASGRVEIDAKPVEAKVGFGILADKPGMSGSEDEIMEPEVTVEEAEAVGNI